MSVTEVSSTEQGADRKRKPVGASVDWKLAGQIGSRLAPAGPRMSDYTVAQVREELAQAAIRAEGPVRAVSLLADGLPIPEARIVDRKEWVRLAASSMATLTGADDQANRGLLRGKVAGVQVGAMLGFLATGILGQYDPFSDDRADVGMLLLVSPNIVAVERALKVKPTDFRLWVCLHEVTHRVQFSANQWLTGYMKESVDLLSQTTEESAAAVFERLRAAMKDRREGTESDAIGQSGVIGLLRAAQAPEQQAAIDRLLVLGTLLEGHADHVMDAVGPAVVPTVEKIREKFNVRRQQPSNPITRLLRVLMGIDTKIEQYVQGKAFVDHVVERVGMAEFNSVWTGPETMPLTSEIKHPDAWIARVLG